MIDFKTQIEPIITSINAAYLAGMEAQEKKSKAEGCCFCGKTPSDERNTDRK